MTKDSSRCTCGFVPCSTKLCSDEPPEDTPFILGLRYSNLDSLGFDAESTSADLDDQINSTRRSPAVAFSGRKLLDGKMITTPDRCGEQSDIGSFVIAIGYLPNGLVESMLQADPHLENRAYWAITSFGTPC